MKIRAFVVEIFAKQYWCFLTVNFSYFPNYTPSKPSEMDNYLIIIDFFVNLISKCMYRMKKRTPVSAYRLFASPSNKQIVFVSFYETPCSLIYEKKYDTKH